MMPPTHLAFSILLGLLAIKFNLLNISNNILFLITISAASIIPDIDIATSFISRKTRMATYAISYFFKHRGVLHSIFIPFMLFAAFYTFNTDVALALLLGYSSHIITDSLTKSGIRPFLPITKYKVRGFIKSCGILDLIILICLIILIIAIMT